MKVSIFESQSADVYGKKVGVGLAVQLVGDTLFLYFSRTIYAPLVHEPTKLRVVVTVLSYAIIASVVAAAFQTETVGLAIGVGAVLGVWVFASFDLTVLAARGDYPIKTAVLDMIYGCVITSVLFAAQHAVS